MNMPLDLLNRRRRGGAVSFSPATLFALSEPGIWLDPSDLTTLYQDRAGTTLVTTPGQSVGIALDKSKGLVLGPELVTNGDFSSGTTGWTAVSATLSDNAGRLQIVATGGAQGASQSFATTNGVRYRGTVTIASATTTYGIGYGNGFGLGQVFGSGFLAGSRTYTFSFVGNGSSNVFWLYSSGAGTFIFDNISVRELPGNHAIAQNDTSRPIYGVVPQGGRRNLLTFTEQFDNAVWNGASNASATSAGGGAFALQDSDTNSFRSKRQAFASVASGVSLTFRVQIKKEATAVYPLIRIIAGATTDRIVNTLSGTVDMSTGTTIVTDPSDANYWLFTMTVTSTSAGAPAIEIYPAASTDGSTLEISATGTTTYRFPQFELGSTATNYQRVGSQYDVTEAGVPSCSYLQFDGTDDWLQTSTITPGTDKAQVFAGVRKLSDAVGHIAGGDGNTSGQLEILSSGWAVPANRYGAGYYTNILAQIDSPANFTPPRTDVLSWRFDTSGATGPDRVKLNVNSAPQSLTISSAPSAGNFGAFAHYIGRRGGTSLPFNGQLFGLIVRFGTNLSTDTITSTETYTAQKTGIEAASEATWDSTADTYTQNLSGLGV